MKYKERIEGLEEAKKLGALVRLGSDYEDFAINLNLGWMLYDSIGTYACLKASPDLNASQISRAWLTDDLDRAQPLLDVFELSDEGAAEVGYPEHKILLFFGPISPQARRVRLEVQRLEPSGPGLSYLHPMVDPFSSMGDHQAVHIMAWEEPDDPMAPIPIGTIAGCWAFNVDCPRRSGTWTYAKRFHLCQEINIGSACMFLEFLDKGITGWRLSSRFLSETNRFTDLNELQKILWESPSPDDLIAQLSEEGLLDSFAPPVMRMNLQYIDSKGEVAKNAQLGEIYGPLGVLNNKFYHYFTPEFDENEIPNRLSVSKIIEMPLPNPWIYNFDPKNISSMPTKVAEELPCFSLKLKLSIEGLYWEDNMMLIAPLAIMDHDSDAQVDLADCAIRNLKNGEACFCLGQSLVDLPQPKASLKREQVYGWQYPPVHKQTRSASFEVYTVNITPKENIVIGIVPVAADRSADQDNYTLPIEDTLEA
ncbi:MAG: hypothetical protein ACI38Q_04700 [Candidatus Bruticola sp.]